MNFEQQLEWFHSIDKLHADAFHECFPGLRFDGWGNSGPEFHARLHKENRQFADSEYYYKGPLEFFHLTSINNLFSILNGIAFRLYNLDSSDDDQEYSYAGKALGLTDERIALAKRYFFAMSFCPIDELQNAHVWDVYGGNFSRAAIIFTIANDPKNWYNYHIAQVKYASITPFKEYGGRVNAIEQANNGITVWCDLSQLIGFHKEAKWVGEKEVRLSTYYPYESFDEYLKYAKADYRLKQGRNRETYYIDLPLWVDSDSGWLQTPGKPELDRAQVLPANYFEAHPQIKIKKIFFGKNSGLTFQEYGHLCDTLRQTCRNRLGYDVEFDLNIFAPDR